MIYLNNSATSYPKPDSVYQAAYRAITGMPPAQFRSSVSAAMDTVEACRKELAALFHIENPARIFFTSGATEAANMILRGLGLQADEYLVTQTEHNSILRPLAALAQKDRKRTDILQSAVIPCNQFGQVSPEAVAASITEKTRAVIVNHCSNVTGAVQDLQAINAVAKKRGLLFIVDASQSAGCIPVDVKKTGIDALIFTGHKALYGIQGTGGFYLREGLTLEPLKYGGTGVDSRTLLFSRDAEIYEVGTENGPGIAALLAGVSFIRQSGLEKIQEKEQKLMSLLYRELTQIPGITVCADGVPAGPLISFCVQGISPSDAAYILYHGYGIVLRTGLHCSPLIHQAMHTWPNGTVRASVSYFNEETDIMKLAEALRECTAQGG